MNKIPENRKFTNAKWRMIPNGNGEKKGLNRYDEIDFRRSAINSLVREMLQNSLDAQLETKSQVQVEFDWFTIKKKGIPDYQTYEKILNDCAKSNSSDLTCKEFFDYALKLINQDILVMRISDFNTTGLDGAVDGTGNWCSAVKEVGFSSKRRNEKTGGSFGIGKAVAYACSSFNTVFFTSLDKNNIKSTIGVAKLATFSSEGEAKNATVYCADERINALLEYFSFDKNYKREKPGTDIFILGFNQPDDLEDKIILAVLENFLIAVCQNQLVVNIHGKFLFKDSIEDLIELLENRVSDNSLQQRIKEVKTYYRLFNKQISGVKEFILDDESFCNDFQLQNNELTLLLCEGENYNRKILCSRAKGMKILLATDWPRGKDFTGILYVTGPKLNKLLLDMETPSHDNWDPKIVLDKKHQKILEACKKALKNFILSKIKLAFFSNITESIDAFGAGEFLPDLQADSGRNKSLKPSLEVNIKDVNVKKPIIKTPEKGGKKPEKDIGIDIDATGDDETPHVGTTPTGSGGTTESPITGGGISGTGGNEGISESPKPIYKLDKSVVRRVIGVDAKNGVYRVVLQKKNSSKQYRLELSYVGEQDDMPSAIIDAKVKSGNANVLNFYSNVINLDCKTGKDPIYVDIKVEDNEFNVWRVECYEIKK